MLAAHTLTPFGVCLDWSDRLPCERRCRLVMVPTRGRRGVSQGPLAEDGPTRVAIVGFGRVGRAVLELAMMRPWVDVVAIVARRAERDGEPAGRTVDGAPGDLYVRTEATSALRDSGPHVVIVATTSRLVDVLPQLEAAAGSGARAILCTSEELAYVKPDDSRTARTIHDLANSTGVAIAATGVNPGFVLDLWPLLLSGLAWDVERLEARRVVDVSVFAPHTRHQLGIGHAREVFEISVADGSIVGHLGFRESLRLLCDAMGRPADRITITTEPLLAEKAYDLADGRVEMGTTVGALQRAEAWHGDKAWISVGLLLHAAPDQDGVRTIDETHLIGRHELHATLQPGAGAILSTAAQLINGIPGTLRAEPGLYGPGQLLPSAPWLAATPPPWGHTQTKEDT